MVSRLMPIEKPLHEDVVSPIIVRQPGKLEAFPRFFREGEIASSRLAGRSGRAEETRYGDDSLTASQTGSTDQMEKKLGGNRSESGPASYWGKDAGPASAVPDLVPK